MMWSDENSALLIFFHIEAMSLEDLATYTLMIVKEPLSGNWSVTYWAWPFSMIPFSLTKRVVILSTRMAVPALVRCKHPIGISGFQKELPFQYSIPFAELVMPSFPR